MRHVPAALSLVAFTVGCGAAPVSPPLPTEAEWLTARAWLGELRATEPAKPFAAIVQVTLREPHTGRSFSARGAVAVDPHRALRMILVGPAGATALDVWATPDRWRFEVPAANILRRGGREDDPSVPIGFFRWWFLAPLEGRLLTSVAGRESEHFVLREQSATIDLTDSHGATGGVAHVVTASRRAADGIDRVAFRGASFAASAGDHATYDQDASGVHVEVSIESPSDAPDPAAFLDPDSPEGQKANAR
jgi:hypothetical protein